MTFGRVLLMIFVKKNELFISLLELFWLGCSSWPKNVSELTRSAKSNLETSEIIANRHQRKEQDAQLNLKVKPPLDMQRLLITH